jgi:hypothetical protein
VTVTVTLYTRAGCHLCEEAAGALAGLARELPIEVRPVDVDLDLELLRRFNDLVPVVAVADEVVASAPIDLDAVRAAVRSAAQASGAGR